MLPCLHLFRGFDLGPADEVVVRRGEHGGHGDSADDEPLARPRARASDEHDGRGRRESAEERARDECGLRPFAGQEDDEDPAGGRAGREADEVGAAQRVARRGLEDRARGRQAGSHGRRGDDPGKALLEQEVGLGAGAVSGEDAGDAARGDLIWARRQSGDGDEEGDPQQPDGHREGAAVHEQRASAGQRDPAVSGGPGAHRRLSRPFRLGAFRLRALRLRRLVSG